MKILHVIISIDPILGGVSQAVRTMIRGLQEKHKTESEVVSLDRPDCDFFNYDPFPLHALGPARGPWAHSPGLIPWLVKNLSLFDAVIIHGLWQFHGYAVGKSLEKLKASRSLPKIYVMPHGMLDPYFQNDPARRLKALRNLIYWKLVERKTINDADGLLFTCEEEKLLARMPFKSYQPKREAVVGLGVEAPPPSSPAMKTAFAAACPQLGDQPYLLFLSRIHQKKGVDLLIDSYANLVMSLLRKGAASGLQQSKQQFPDLVIAGPLDSPYAEEMKALATELLAPPESQDVDSCSTDCIRTPRIHFPGMLRDDAKWGAFFGCDAFILPSHQENFGIAVVEALACGKPTIISNKVNIWRDIAETGAGLVEADNASGCLKQLEEFFQMDSNDRRAMGKQALECYNSRFGIEAAAEKLLTVLS